MSRPLCIDLFCGLGGWTEGFLAEGWDVVGFDIEQHVYGEERYPAMLVLQDVRTIHGKQFKNADMIVASSPCQAYSYMAMPWSKAKQIAAALLGKAEFPEGYKGYRTIDELNDLFEQPKRIQREAIEAAGGRFIPLIQENVRGAIPWVGRSQWHYGSFHLWGDVPALMPTTMGREILKAGVTHRADGTTNFHGHKNPGFRFDGSDKSFQTASVDGLKNTGGSWFNIPGPGGVAANNNPTRLRDEAGIKAGDRNKSRANGGDGHQWTTSFAETLHDNDGVKMGGGSWFGDYTPKPADGVKQGGDWFNDPKSMSRQSSSKSKARKAASAKIAKIPFPLSSHIARVYRPRRSEAA